MDPLSSEEERMSYLISDELVNCNHKLDSKWKEKEPIYEKIRKINKKIELIKYFKSQKELAVPFMIKLLETWSDDIWENGCDNFLADKIKDIIINIERSKFPNVYRLPILKVNGIKGKIKEYKDEIEEDNEKIIKYLEKIEKYKKEIDNINL